MTAGPFNIRLVHIPKGNQYKKWRVEVNGIQRGYLEQDAGTDPEYAWQAKSIGNAVISTVTPVNEAVQQVLSNDILVPIHAAFNPVTGNLRVTFNHFCDDAESVEGFTVKAGNLGLWVQSEPGIIAFGDDYVDLTMVQDDKETQDSNSVTFVNTGDPVVDETGELELPNFTDFPLEIV